MVSPATKPTITEDRKAQSREQAERIGDALAGQLLAQLEAWARQVQLMEDAEDAAFLTTPPTDFLNASPLQYEGAGYIMARSLFPGIMPDADYREADRLNGFADNAFMVARVALMAEVAKANKQWFAYGASMLFQCAAAVAERLLREGHELQAAVDASNVAVEEGSRDNG